MSQNRASDAFSRGAFQGVRPQEAENRTTKVTNAYDSIVCVLAAAGLSTGVTQWRIERGLIEMLGASQPRTLRRHLELMVKLGYLKKVAGSTVYQSAQYDLVGSKLKEIALRRKAQELVARQKGEGRRC